MSLRTKIKESDTLTPQEKLVMGLLEEPGRTNRQIIDILMSEPFYLELKEVFDAMNSLNSKGLIRIRQFVIEHKRMDVDVLLTVAVDWVLKL